MKIRLYIEIDRTTGAMRVDMGGCKTIVAAQLFSTAATHCINEEVKTQAMLIDPNRKKVEVTDAPETPSSENTPIGARAFSTV